MKVKHDLANAHFILESRVGNGTTFMSKANNVLKGIAYCNQIILQSSIAQILYFKLFLKVFFKKIF